MSNRGPARALLAIAVVGLAAAMALWWRFTVDDSYITYRYAENLGLGNGAVFNLGERVEGYSCPMWMAVLAAVVAVGADPIFVSKALGLACAFALIWLLYRTLLRADCDPLLAGAAALWLAVTPGIHIYAASGMETLPYALAVAVAAFLPAFPIDAGRRPWLIAASLVAAGTFRPEGMLVLLMLAGAWVVCEPRRPVLLGAGAALVAAAVLLLARYAYYDAWLPNTYLAKPSPVLSVLAHGSRSEIVELVYYMYADAMEALENVGGLLVLAAAVFGLLLRGRQTVARTAAVAFAVGAVFEVYAPQDWMPEHRFALPFMTPLLFLAALGVDSVRAALAPTGRLAFHAAVAVALLLWTATNTIESVREWQRYERGHIIKALDADIGHAPIGRWLAEHASAGDRVLAYEIGAVGYFSRLAVLDHEGLITPPVARIVHAAGGYRPVRSGSDREAMQSVVAYCVGERPEWFLLRSRTEEPLEVGKPVPQGIAEEPIQNALLAELGPSMVLGAVFPMGRPFELGKGRTLVADKYLLLRRSSAG